ncbi:MAG: endonuclease/exonuclease/phosphatase family protein [Gemmobacter sp.]
MAEPLRIAAFHAGLTRDGPGLLLRDILSGRDPQVEAVVTVIVASRADVLLLSGFDHDLGGAALTALADRLAEAGHGFPHRFAPMQNRGIQSGHDLDGDGRTGGREDAQGYGRFAGAGSMAILSRLPLDTNASQDFAPFLWRDLPGARLPDVPDRALEVQRLASSSHWVVPAILPDGRRLHLLAWSATAPNFGRGDRNLRRNHDETAFWLRLLDGALSAPPPAPPFVILGHANIDPEDGAGDPSAIRALLDHPAVQDPRPRRAAEPDRSGANAAHRGDPALDTADLRDDPGPGDLRLTYVLPASGLSLSGAGVLWPPPDDPLAAEVSLASRHRLVWVDLLLSQPP